MSGPPRHSAKLAEGPVGATLARLAFPMLIALLGMVGFNIADTYFIAQLGTHHLAAISFTFPVVMVITSLSIGLGVGVGAVVSRAIGQGDSDRVRRLTTDSLVLVFLIVSVVAAAGLLTIEPLFHALGAGDDLIPLISDYMSVWFFGVPVVIIPMVGNGAIRATGDTRTPATVMLIAMLANVLLDPLFIFGYGPIPAMGMQGAALATIGSRSITLVIALYVLIKRERMISFTPPRWSQVAESWKSVLTIGLPASLTNLIVPASMAIVTRIISGYGVAAVAGFGVATRLEMVPMMIIQSLGAVIVPFVGQNWGAKRLDRVQLALKRSYQFSILFGLVAFVVFFLAAEPLAGLFDDNPAVVEVTAAYVRIVALAWGLQGVLMLSTSALNALNRPLSSTFLSALRMGVLYLPLAFLGAWLWDLEGVFVAALVANIVTGLLSMLWVRRAVRQEQLDRPRQEDEGTEGQRVPSL